MKKRLLYVLSLVSLIVIVLHAHSALADVFNWSIVVESQNFEERDSWYHNGPGAKEWTSSLPPNTQLKHLFYHAHTKRCTDARAIITINGAEYDNTYVAGSADDVYKEFSFSYLSIQDLKITYGYERGGNVLCGNELSIAWNFQYAIHIYNGQSFANRFANGINQPRPLGNITDYLKSTFFLNTSNGEVFKVVSHNPSILIWVGVPEQEDKNMTTTDEKASIYACEDIDQNGVCDYVDAEQCEADGGAWYTGICCISDPASDTPSCKVYTELIQEGALGIVKNITFPKPALCGINKDNKIEWAFIEDVGNIHDFTFTCPDITMVSDGKDYYKCGQNTSIQEYRTLQNRLNLKSFESLEIPVGDTIHSLYCFNNTITECRGTDIAMSYTNAEHSASAGQIIQTSTGSKYCLDDGAASADLDHSEEACKSAQQLDGSGTEKWTGHYCCSEDLDLNDTGETYNDPYDARAFKDVTQSSAGGCWDQTWIAKSTLGASPARNIINAQGVFYGCHVNDPAFTTKQDSKVGGAVLQQMNNCDKLDLGVGGEVQDLSNLPTNSDSTIEKFRYAVCQPFGNFTFTNDATPAIVKTISWNVSISTNSASANSSRHTQGCCPADQCWNGNGCQAKGTFIQVGESGFQCN